MSLKKVKKNLFNLPTRYMILFYTLVHTQKYKNYTTLVCKASKKTSMRTKFIYLQFFFFFLVFIINYYLIILC